MFDWYRLFNKEEFEDLEIVSKEFDVELEGGGIKSVMVTQGNRLSILVDDIFLSIGLNDRSPFRFGERAVFLDENDDVWLGVWRAD